MPQHAPSSCNLAADWLPEQRDGRASAGHVPVDNGAGPVSNKHVSSQGGGWGLSVSRGELPPMHLPQLLSFTVAPLQTHKIDSVMVYTVVCYKTNE